MSTEKTNVDVKKLEPEEMKVVTGGTGEIGHVPDGPKSMIAKRIPKRNKRLDTHRT